MSLNKNMLKNSLNMRFEVLQQNKYWYIVNRVCNVRNIIQKRDIRFGDFKM